MRAAVVQMRADLKDKAISHSIDADCVLLDTKRVDLGLFRDTVRLGPSDRYSMRAMETGDGPPCCSVAAAAVAVM